MIKYQYQIIRYIHDRITGEFVNVGLVMFEPDSKYLDCKVITKYSRISHFFGDINGSFLLSTLKQFQNQVCEISKSFDEFLNNKKDFKDVSSITNYLLPKDDSALIVTDVSFGIDLKMEAAFDDLYNRLIERYTHDNDHEKHTDHYAWQKVYKSYFDKLGVTPKLKKHSVKTKKDSIDFDKAWKNGVWNCYQTLSFDLVKADTIKSKVYKWSGILKELETSDEKMSLYFLTTTPKVDEPGLSDFIKSTLEDHGNDRIKISIVTEAEAEGFAAKVRKAMQESKIL
jgi:hypothetical protein